MSTIKIPDRRIGTTEIARVHNTTRQTAGRWCSLGLLETASLDALVGMKVWTVELWEVLLFTRPAIGRTLRSRPSPEFTAPSLSEEQIRAYVAQMEK